MIVVINGTFPHLVVQRSARNSTVEISLLAIYCCAARPLVASPGSLNMKTILRVYASTRIVALWIE